MKNKGFTLIELLAVILVMGILMLVAIPSVTKLINNSRKDTFINTINTYNESIKTMWEANMLSCGSNNIKPEYLNDGEYYILIDSENNNYVSSGGSSSWNDRPIKGYMKVLINNSHTNNKKEIFSIAITDGIHGIKETSIKNGIIRLDRKNIIMNFNDAKNKNILDSINKDPFIEGNKTTCVLKERASTSETVFSVVPENPPQTVSFKFTKSSGNKNKNKLEVGDKLDIEKEEFLVLKETKIDNSDSEYVTIIAKHNLSLKGTPRQDPNTKDTVVFATKAYWKYNGGNPYVYKENNQFSMIDDYLKKYKESLEELGITFPEKDYKGLPPVRLIAYEEFNKLGQGHKVLNSSKDWWTGSVPWSKTVWGVFDEACLQVYNLNTKKSVRPVITLPKKFINYL